MKTFFSFVVCASLCCGQSKQQQLMFSLGTASPGFAFVQKKASAGAVASASTRTLTFDSNTTIGNLLVVSTFGCMNAGCNIAYTGTISVTDLLSTVYQLDHCVLTQDTGAGIFYPICTFTGLATSSGANTVTVTYNTADGWYACALGSEYSGVKTTSWLDQIGESHNSGAANPSVTTAGATTVAGELIHGMCAVQVAGSSGAGYTQLSIVGGSIDEYKIGTTAQFETATFSSLSAAYQCSIQTYKPQ